MSIINLTYNPLLSLSVKATSDIPKHRFVNFTGNLCGNNQKSLGVSDVAFDSGNDASAIVIGTAIIETAEELFVGDEVTSNADGKAKAIAASEPINGIVLKSTSSGDYALIKLI